MRIVDAQVHIWSSGAPSGNHRQVPVFTAAELLAEMDAAGVDAAVIHPPVSWDPGSNDWQSRRRGAGRSASPCSAKCRSTGRRKARRGSSAGASCRAWWGCATRWCCRSSRTWHADGTMDWLWPEAERLGLPVATMAWRFLPVFQSVAERHPNLRLIIDHLGLVRSAQDDAAFANLGELLALARLPNVAVKATGAPGYSTAPYPFRNIHDGLRASSTPSGRGASSGAPTSPACRAATASA
jgi:hypothetical protein